MTFFRLQTEGFRIGKILASSNSPLFAKEVSLSPEEKALFEEPFFYLAKGQECYVFESRNKKYVVKCIRKHKERPPFWLALPFFKEKREQFLLRLKEKKVKKEKSFEIAATSLKEETGLLYTHLEETKGLGFITLYDALGRRHEVPLDLLECFVQKKMEKVKLTKETAKEVIDSFLAFIRMRVGKNIRNKNRHCLKNMGYLEGKVVEYDLGELRYRESFSDPKKAYEEKVKSTRDLKKWLEKNTPELIGYYEEQLALP